MCRNYNLRVALELVQGKYTSEMSRVVILSSFFIACPNKILPRNFSTTDYTYNITFQCLVVCVSMLLKNIKDMCLSFILWNKFCWNELCKSALTGIFKIFIFILIKMKNGLLFHRWNYYTYLSSNIQVSSKLYTFVLQKGISTPKCAFTWYVHCKHTECTSSFSWRAPVFQVNLESYLELCYSRNSCPLDNLLPWST